MSALPSKDLLGINLNRLEEECARNPQLAYEWGQARAVAARAAKEARNALKLKCARVARDFRQDPHKFGYLKATEDTVKEVVAQDLGVQEQQDVVVQAEYEEEVLEAFTRAVQDRKEELGNTVRLHGQMYWSKPDTTAPDEDRVATSAAAARQLNQRP